MGGIKRRLTMVEYIFYGTGIYITAILLVMAVFRPQFSIQERIFLGVGAIIFLVGVFITKKL